MSTISRSRESTLGELLVGIAIITDHPQSNCVAGCVFHGVDDNRGSKNMWPMQLNILSLSCLIVLPIVAASRSAYAVEAFTRINTNNTDQIADTRLFFATSEHGFVHSNKTGSPLQGSVPDVISGPKHIPVSSTDTILAQAIDTTERGFHTLEGGLPGGQWIWIIAGGVLGGIAARFLGQHPLLGAIIGAIVATCLGSVMYEFDDFVLYVDNATDQDVFLCIDTFAPIESPARSQVGVKFEEGRRRIRTLKASGKSQIECFDVDSTKYRDAAGDTISGYYIYNVAAKNKYSITHAVYSPN